MRRDRWAGGGWAAEQTRISETTHCVLVKVQKISSLCGTNAMAAASASGGGPRQLAGASTPAVTSTAAIIA